MDAKGEFVRLNRRQRAVLRVLKPYAGVPDFFEKLGNGEVRVAGMEPGSVLAACEELQGTGYLTLRANGVGKVDRRLNPAASFDLSTVCDCYRSEHFHYVMLPVLLQLVGGASGGLVVWLLSLLVG